MKKMMMSCVVSLAALVAVPGVAVAEDGEAVFKRTPICQACHRVDVKMVGPSLKDVAAKYAGTEGAVEHLVKSIRQGSSGIWGPVPMTPNAAMISEDDAAAVARWILTLK